MPEIRALNQDGLSAFCRFLVHAAKIEPTAEPPFSLLCDGAHTSRLEGVASVDFQEFDSKYAFGSYIHEQVHGRIPVQVLRSSPGIWAWLALFYFDLLCPPGTTGRRKVLRPEKYVASADNITKGLDKHLLYFPWKLVWLHGDSAAWMLYPPLRQDTKLLRDMANSYRRNVRKEFVELARSLFFDETRRKFKRGHATGGSETPGTMRRLDRVTDQLDLTYDVFGLNAGELAGLLPTEFDRWRAARR
jgi:hypothetical protein